MDLRVPAVVCYTNRTCDFFGGFCSHFQGICAEMLNKNDPIAYHCEDETTFADTEPQCGMSRWTKFVDAVKEDDVQFVVSYHWVVRALGRSQPGTMQEFHLIREPPFHKLNFRNATERLAVALPENVVMNGCIHFFFANQNETYQWSAPSFLELTNIFAISVKNNIRIFRHSLYEGPIVYQGCSPLSCTYLSSLYGRTQGAQGMPVEICEAKNFVGRQANKRLRQLFRYYTLSK